MRATFVALLTTLLLIACTPDPGSDSPETVGVEEAPPNTAVVTEQTPTENAGVDEVPLGRLPDHVQPTGYRLEFTVLPDRSHFDGHTEIDLEFERPTRSFFLHGRSLEVSGIVLQHRGEAGETLETAAEWTTAAPKDGVARVTLARAVEGQATLLVDYRAPFNESLDSLYRVQEGGEWYAFTQFQAIAARDAFPGFDEPGFKVPFEISLTVRQGHVAIANTPVSDTLPLDDGLKRVEFATTPPLPTYLVAFMVGPFDVREAPELPPTAIREQPLPLRGLAVKGKGSELTYALEHTRGLMESLEAYFDMPYPYAKLDLVAVPDFSAGAMENAGAITYRESLLLVEENDRPQTLRTFKMVHAHELAHQWFGNLVTPTWWDDIWLNESFATWMAHVGMDEWQPEGGWRRDLAQRALAVMDSDALATAQPIRKDVKDNNDIATAFDGITFSKGGGVLGMFEHWLGHDAFRRGVRTYLSRHAWGNATAEDFVTALQSAASPDMRPVVGAAFRSFLEQPGVPLLAVDTDCRGNRVDIRLAQSRDLPLGSDGETDQTWVLPACVRFGDGEGGSDEACLVMDNREAAISVGDAGCPAWVMPNAAGAGYYRWSLPQVGWEALLDAMDQLSVEELMSAGESLDAGFDSGALDVATLASAAERLKDHPDFRIATAAHPALEFVLHRVATEEQRDAVRQRYARMFAQELDLATTRDDDAARRQSAMAEFLALQVRLPALRVALAATAHGMLDFGDAGAPAPNDNLAGLALRVAVEDDQHDAHFSRQLLERALESKDSTFRARALNALGYTQDPALRAEMMALVLDERLRDNEIFLVLSPQMSMPETREAAWSWLQQNFDAVLTRVPDWRKANLISYGALFCDSGRLDEVTDFFEPWVGRLQGGQRRLDAMQEAMRLCAAKAQYHAAGLAEWLGVQ